MQGEIEYRKAQGEAIDEDYISSHIVDIETEASRQEKHALTMYGILQGSDPCIVLRLQTIKTIVNSRRFKGSSCEEPRRVQVLDSYCLTRFESENSRRGDVY